MKINTKISGFLITSFFFVFLFLGATSISTLLNSQRDNIEVSKNEFLEISRELMQESANFFFSLLDKRLQDNPSLSSQDILKIISEIDPSYNKNVVVIDTKQKNAIPGYDRTELNALIDKSAIERYLNAMVLNRKKDFYRDNYEEFLIDKKGIIVPTAAHFRIYEDYGLIVGYGRTMYAAKLRIEFMKKKNEDYFKLHLLFALLIYAGATLIAIFVSMRFMKIFFIVPLKEIDRGVKRVAQGDLEARITIQSKDEIGDLARAFNQMTQDLQKTTTSIVNLNKEVAERKLAEEALQQGENYQKTIFNSVQAGVMVVDAETHLIVDVNPEIVKAFGADKDKIVGSLCHQYICPAEKGKCPITDLGLTVDNAERALVKANGERMPVLKTVVPIILNNKKFLLESFVDITERKKAEEEREVLIKELKEHEELLNRQKQEVEDSRKAIKNVAEDLRKSKEALEAQKGSLEDINKELDDFTYIISHDLKEPLRSIDAFSKFLEDDYKEKLSEDGRGYIKRIRANTTRMQSLIEDLLEISRIERKRNPLEEVQAQDLIGEVRLMLEYAIKEKNVEIVIQDNLPKIFCDRVRLVEVFVNLVSNAIKFNDKPNPRIEVGCNQRDNCYEFYVKDNGPGIEQQYYEKIFEIFQRLGKREDAEGTGAGLTIAKKIIEMHKGKIWVESKVGEYTVFYFTIPKRKQAILGKKKLGEILVEKKLVTEEELKKALDEQGETG